MQPTTPTALYQQALAAGDYQPDEVQRRAVARLDTLYQELNQRQSARPVNTSLRGRLNRLIGRAAPRASIRPAQAICGAVLGGVKPG